MNKLKNIFNLSKFYIKENEASASIIKKNPLKSENKKGILFLYIILIFGILYLSTEIISYIVKLGKPEIFLNIFLLLLNVLIIMKTVMVSLNVFYFSKNIESVLHLPLKPSEILISKFNTLLFMNYEIEIIIALIPLLVYGALTSAGLLYYINTIIILLIFPIFSTLVVSIIMIIMMKTIKFFKNKDLMQVIISFVFICIIVILVNYASKNIFNNLDGLKENKEIVLNSINEKILGINKYFYNINPTSIILQENGFLISLINYIKLIFINICAFGLFIILGNRLYLKQLLNAKFYYKVKKLKEINLNRKCKKNSIGISYLKKEIKILIKNPMFFIQCIYPVIIITFLIVVFAVSLIPVFRAVLQKEEFNEIRESLRFDIEAVCLIIGTVQIVGLFNYTAITSFSREGKNAYIIKILPIDLFRQFIYKSIPQIIINTIASIIIFLVINYKISEIGIAYIAIMFVLSTILIIINSFILCLIDLFMPKLDWDGEYEILKNNKNKLLQYVLIVFNILFLILIKEIFEKIELNISLVIILAIFIVILVSFGFIINKNKRNLFKRIN